RAAHFLQPAKEISDNKPAPDSPFFCMFSGDGYRCRRTVDTGHLKPKTCQVDRIVAGTAPEIGSPAGPDFPFLHKSDKRIRWGLAVPREIIQRYGLVYPVDIGIFHARHPDERINRDEVSMFPRLLPERRSSFFHVSP